MNSPPTVINDYVLGIQYGDFDDDITINGNSLDLKEDKVYYLLNKPRGIITSTSDEKNRKTVVDLIPEKIYNIKQY